MTTWTTRTAAVAALRVQMQDGGGTQRYTDTELGEALDSAIAELSAARPIISTITATLDASRVVRLDNAIGASVFGSVVDVLNADGEPIRNWYYFEQTSQHKMLIPASVAVGATVTIRVRGGYGFSITVTGPGTIDTNIPAAWRDALLEGAQGFVLDLYGAREVGRTNVAPAMAQQTARAASVKLRDFRQWVSSLPYTDQMRQFVEWGLANVDARTDEHRGFG